jgi:hypothetical protein
MSNPTNEPSCKPNCKTTNDQTTNEVRPSSTSNTSHTFEAVNGVSHVQVKDIVNNRADASQPTVAKTSDRDEINNVINAQYKYKVTGQVAFSDWQESEIQSMCLDESKP